MHHFTDTFRCVLTNVYTIKIQNILISFQKVPSAFLQLILISTPNPSCFHFFPFLDYYINAVIQHILFCVWLLLRSILVLRFIHVVAYINSPFLLIAE